MAINHGNIYNKLLALVLRRYKVPHAEVNVTEQGREGRTGTRTGTGTERDGHRGQNGTKNGEGRGQRE